MDYLIERYLLKPRASSASSGDGFSGKYSRSLARERVVFDDALHDPELWLSTLSTLRLDYLTGP
jgi:hypothetical protein